MSKNFVFGVNPTITKKRSKFSLNYTHKTTMNVGDLCPVYLQEVYPGDTFSGESTFVCRSTNPYVRVPMDNLFLDIAYFFVPHRIVYSNWKALMGENTQSAWIQSQSYSVPQVGVTGNVITEDSIASYFGIPKGTTVTSISALPFRGYAMIYNEFWRDQNLIDPTYINLGDTDNALNSNAFAPNNYLGKVAKACKVHDYFTTCLPGTQKGTAPTLPITGSSVPVVTTENDVVTGTGKEPLHMRGVGTLNLQQLSGTSLGVVGLDGASNQTAIIGALEDVNGQGQTALYPSNLAVDFTNANIQTGTINDLRTLFQIQKLYELSARGGTRYRETLFNLFGVRSSDATQQVPEYLGGRRTPLTISQVNQTTVGTDGQTIGAIGGYTHSIGQSKFGKSFTEHGYIIGVAVIRQYHTYQQGIERHFFRRDRLDFYNPLFAHLGEQKVSVKELYAFGNDIDLPFGYQEAYADLRYRPSIITGALNSLYNNSLDVFHFGDEYASKPLLGSDFIKETPSFVDRTLSVPSTTMPQFVLDFYHKFNAIRVLPLYGIPGLIDHF